MFMSTSEILSVLRAAGRQQITASTLHWTQETGSHVWIQGFTQVREKVANGAFVMSRMFSVGGHDWRIRCYPNGETKELEGPISLYLQHDSHAKTGDATATFKMSIIDKSWKPSCTRSSSGEGRLFTRGAWGWNKFIKLEDLDKETHLKDDCLSILCDVTVHLGLQTYAHEVAAAEGVTKVISNQTDDMDVTIQVRDGQTFAAHRWLLESRSPVFMADLALAARTCDDSTAAGLGLRLCIDDMDVDVCEAMLRFIYTNSPPLELEGTLTERLLVAADRYKLEKLKFACEEALCKKIDTGSVAASLALAERHRCPELREACMQFLSSPGNLNAAMVSDGFEQLKTGCPSVLLELLLKKMASMPY